MRAQLTLEYLIIASIILVLLSISLAALFKISKSADVLFELLSFKSDVLNIYSMAEDVCALGNGNSRVFTIKTAISVSSDAELVVFEHGGTRIIKKLECQLYDDRQELSAGSVTVKNNDGEIELIQNP